MAKARACTGVGLLYLSLLITVSTCTTVKDFQPSIVPMHSVTTLTIATADQLNISANSTVQCRFNDMSMPAVVRGGLVLCDTPPIRDTDKAALHVDVDGTLFKAKRPLRFHEPFKAMSISPRQSSPAQQISIKISGIKCEDWMQFYVRFQSADATKKTQQGVCVNSTVTCYIPEFPARTLLRVGVTLSNRIVEWAPDKLIIQYPVDAMKSSLNDLSADTSKRGAFAFKVLLKDKFHNRISLSSDSQDSRALSVQYRPYNQAEEFKFINCDVATIHTQGGSAYSVKCAGAEHERILVYPSINNVPVGGKSAYEVRTTLCPEKRSCDDKTTLIIIICCVCAGVLLLVSAVIIYRRRRTIRSRRLRRSKENLKKETEEGQEIPLSGKYRRKRKSRNIESTCDDDASASQSQTSSVEDLPSSTIQDFSVEFAPAKDHKNAPGLAPYSTASRYEPLPSSHMNHNVELELQERGGDSDTFTQTGEGSAEIVPAKEEGSVAGCDVVEETGSAEKTGSVEVTGIVDKTGSVEETGSADKTGSVVSVDAEEPGARTALLGPEGKSPR